MTGRVRSMHGVVVGITLLLLLMAVSVFASAPTERTTNVGTPRAETIIVYPFSGRTTVPDQHNPLMAYNVWFGMKDLGMGWLWEMDTTTGKHYAELAASMPEVLNAEHTKFRIKLRDSVYWSDGVKFTADDVIFTIKTMLEDSGKLTWFGVAQAKGLIKSYKKIDDYSIELETKRPLFILEAELGVYTWASGFSIVPKHIFEKQPDISQFRNTPPVVLGPYTLEKFDKNGMWSLWKRRDDWQRSAIGYTGKMPGPKYVIYQVFGTEETLALALIQNELDGYAFISTEVLATVREKNPDVKGFASKFPYHDFHEPCQWGIVFNCIKKPYDKADVRWGLALSIDAREVAMTTVAGETKINPFPMGMLEGLKPLWEPLMPWVESYKFADGYQPFDTNWTKNQLDYLKSLGSIKDLPGTVDEAKKYLGMGWWKYDPQKASELFERAGLKKDNNGKWLLADGTPWVINLIIPGDWTKLYQRYGLGVASSWEKAGLTVNVQQLPDSEFWDARAYNNRFDVTLTQIMCPFNMQLRDFPEYQKKFILPVDSKDPASGNRARWANDVVDPLAAKMETMDPASAQYLQAAQTMVREMIKDMPFIKIQEVPTTMAQNEHYWTNWPKQENFYVIPYIGWSSFKYQLLGIKPAASK